MKSEPASPDEDVSRVHFGNHFVSASLFILHKDLQFSETYNGNVKEKTN